MTTNERERPDGSRSIEAAREAAWQARWDETNGAYRPHRREDHNAGFTAGAEWGIAATIEQFRAAMEDRAYRTDGVPAFVPWRDITAALESLGAPK